MSKFKHWFYTKILLKKQTSYKIVTSRSATDGCGGTFVFSEHFPPTAAGETVTIEGDYDKSRWPEVIKGWFCNARL